MHRHTTQTNTAQDTKPDPSSTVDVYLTKTVTPDAVQNVGDVFTFTITVGLNSLTPAANVVVTDNVPPQLEVLEIVEVPKQNGERMGRLSGR